MRFRRQSRLLAVSAAAVVLVEPDVGTLASAVAEQARLLNRPVFAVPGPVVTPGRDMARRRHHHEAVRAARLLGESAPVELDEPPPYRYAHQLLRDEPLGSSVTPFTSSPTWPLPVMHGDRGP